MAALLQEAGPGETLAGVVFGAASFTDALDGWIARRQKSVSTFGKLMDPLADKLLVTAALVSLVSLQRLSAWVAMVIIAREFAVTGLRQLAMEHGEVIPASIWGKLKTVAQVAMVLVLITVENSPAWVDALVWLTTIITVISGADYFFGFRSLVQARQARRAAGWSPRPSRARRRRAADRRRRARRSARRGRTCRATPKRARRAPRRDGPSPGHTPRRSAAGRGSGASPSTRATRARSARRAQPRGYARPPPR